MLSLSGELGSSSSFSGTPSGSKSSPGSPLGVLTRSGGGSRLDTDIDNGIDVDSGRSWLGGRLRDGNGGSANTGDIGSRSRSLSLDVLGSLSGNGGKGVGTGCGDAVHLYP